MTTYKELAKKYNISKSKKALNNNEWDKLTKLYSSSSEEKLLNTPELVELYINKWELNNNIRNIINKRIS